MSSITFPLPWFCFVTGVTVLFAYLKTVGRICFFIEMGSSNTCAFVACVFFLRSTNGDLNGYWTLVVKLEKNIVQVELKAAEVNQMVKQNIDFRQNIFRQYKIARKLQDFRLIKLESGRNIRTVKLFKCQSESTLRQAIESLFMRQVRWLRRQFQLHIRFNRLLNLWGSFRNQWDWNNQIKKSKGKKSPAAVSANGDVNFPYDSELSVDNLLIRKATLSLYPTEERNTRKKTIRNRKSPCFLNLFNS